MDPPAPNPAHLPACTAIIPSRKDAQLSNGPLIVPQENSEKMDARLILSLTAVLLGSFILRTAAGVMGETIQFYFNYIHEAALSVDHPLRAFVGAGQLRPISYTLGGVIIGAFFATELLGSPLFGAWSDRWGRKVFILLGPLLGAVAVQITAMTTVVWLLIITRLLEGLSTASNAPATLGYIAEATSGSAKLRTRIAGLFEVATIGGMALGFSLGGWFWHHFGTPAIVAGIPLTSPAFALDALLYIASFLLMWAGIREVGQRKRVPSTALPAIDRESTWHQYWRILRSPKVAGFAPAWIAINAVLGVWINLTARILTDRRGMTGQILVGRFNSMQAGNIIAIFAGFFVLGILLWSMFGAQVKKTTAMIIGTSGLLASCAVLYAINHQPALESPFVTPLVVVLVICFMVQSGFTPAALAHLANITEDFSANRGVIMGLYSVFLGLGQFLGASIGGLFVDRWGADGVALVTGILGVFAMTLILKMRQSEHAT
jgi:MFS family permease